MSSPFPHSIILIGNYIPDKQESMLRFAMVLETELKKKGLNVKIVRPIPVLYRFKTKQAFLDKWIGYIDKFVIFPFALRKLARSTASERVLFHICDHSNATYGSCLRGKWSITCHDLLAIQSALGEIPENPTRLTGRILQSWILNGLRKAPHVACDSDYTANQVTRLAEIPKERLKVIRLGLNEPFRLLNSTERGEILDRLFKARGMNRPTRYLFHVGGNHWYKNRRGLIEIFSQVATSMTDIQLVFAGSDLPAELTQLIKEKGLDQRVFDIGGISHDELNSLYSGAEALAFPSLVEGFGWPVIEAQASGCPVIASDRAPLNEITREAAILIDPLATHETAQTILSFLKWTPEAKKKLIDKGLANSTYFTTERMIQDYLAFYRDILFQENHRP